MFYYIFLVILHLWSKEIWTHLSIQFWKLDTQRINYFIIFVASKIFKNHFCLRKLIRCCHFINMSTVYSDWNLGRMKVWFLNFNIELKNSLLIIDHEKKSQVSQQIYLFMASFRKLLLPWSHLKWWYSYILFLIKNKTCNIIMKIKQTAIVYTTIDKDWQQQTNGDIRTPLMLQLLSILWRLFHFDQGK